MQKSAKDNWYKLRELGVPSLSRLRNTTDADTSKALRKWRDGKDELTLSHGIHLRRTVLVHDKVLCIIYNKHRSQFVALDCRGTIQVYSETGKKEKLRCVAENAIGIIYATKGKKYVCWGSDNQFHILNDELSTCSQFSYEDVINNALYNEFTHDILTLGNGCVQIWMFRQGNQLLVSKATISDGLANKNIYHAAIEPTFSHLQRCFVVVGRNINVYNVKQQTLIGTANNAHGRPITGILYIKISKAIITCCQDGSIKTWNSKLCVMSVFVGHSSSVTGMTQYVDTSQLLSSSEDGTIRLWSLDFNNEIDVLRDQRAVLGVLSLSDTNSLVSKSERKLTFWKIANIHKLFTHISKKILLMKPTTHPKMFIRVMCLCNDGCVRIICPTNGHVITTAVGPEDASLVDAVYSPFDASLFLLLSDGKICTYSPKSNPCQLEKTWTNTINPDNAACCLLCIYEYFAEDFVAEDRWDTVLRKAKQANYSFPSDHPVEKNSNGHTLLLGGLENGVIVVYDWSSKQQNGNVSFSIQGHKGSITAMTSNPKCGQLVTAGNDKVVKVWRVFPFAQEALAPSMMFVIHDQPTHIACSFWRLCIVSQNESAASFTTSIYSTKENHKTEKGQFKHDCMEDHNETITGLASCEKLRLFATCSLDGSVRIWNESNSLRRIVKLNAKPKNIVFTSDRGDIIVSIGKSIHRIQHQEYLPSVYVYQMVTMSILDCPGIEQIAASSDIWNCMTARERRCLKSARSLMLESRIDDEDLPADEMLERKNLMEEKQRVFSKLSKRDIELLQIRDGNAAKKPRVKLSEKDTEKTFKNYISLFYKKPDILLPIEDTVADTSQQQLISKSAEKVIVDRSSTGFFSISPKHSLPRKSPELQDIDLDNRIDDKIILRQRSKSLIEEKNEKYIPVTCRPSSADSVTIVVEKTPHVPETPLLKPTLITPMCSDIEQQKHSHAIMVTAHPSCLSNVASIMKVHKEASAIFEKNNNNKRSQIDVRNALPVAPDCALPNSVVVALYRDLKQKPEESVIEIERWQPKQLSSMQLDHIHASKVNLERSLSRSMQRSRQQLSPVSYQESISPRQSPDMVGIGTEDSFVSLQSNSPMINYDETTLDEDVIPDVFFKTEVPSISPIIQINKDEYVENTLVLNDNNSDTQANDILPPFVCQFETEPWFSLCFPPPNPKIFSEAPFTLSKFIEILLRQLLTMIPNPKEKKCICEAITLLCKQNAIDSNILHLVFNAALHFIRNNQANNDNGMLAFLQSCIQMVLITKVIDAVLVVEMMLMWISNSDIREDISRAFITMGLIDPKHKVVIAMTKLRAKSGSSLTSENWIDKTRFACQEWLSEVVAQHNKTISSNTDKLNTSRSQRGILKAKEKAFQRENLNLKQFKKISFAHTNFTSQTLSTNPIDAINNFCQLQMEKDADNLMAAQLMMTKKKPQKPRGKKNTVLALPPIDGYVSLARRGDTHQSQCHPNRETALAHNGLTLPPIPSNCTSILSMAHSLSLHLHKIDINPFYSAQEPTLIKMNNLAITNYKKYFVPIESYDHNELTLQ